jgi:hypothetical protein
MGGREIREGWRNFYIILGKLEEILVILGKYGEY